MVFGLLYGATFASDHRQSYCNVFTPETSDARQVVLDVVEVNVKWKGSRFVDSYEFTAVFGFSNPSDVSEGVQQHIR